MEHGSTIPPILTEPPLSQTYYLYGAGFPSNCHSCLSRASTASGHIASRAISSLPLHVLPAVQAADHFKAPRKPSRSTRSPSWSWTPEHQRAHRR